MATFEGFPEDTFRFLADLRSPEHNHKPWFDAHRDRYERSWLAPAQALLTALGERIADLSPAPHAVPRVQGGSIMRVNRDVRFSKDKRPYKDHLDLWIWAGEGPSRACPGFGIRITADTVGVGAGKHDLDKDALAALRRRLLEDDDAAGAFADLLDGLRRDGFPTSGQRARPPKGVPADHPRADLLRYDWVWAGNDEPRPAWISGPRAVDELEARARRLWPLVRWLSANVSSRG